MKASIFLFIFIFSFQTLACTLAERAVNAWFESRRDALRNLKRDAQIDLNAPLISVRRVNMMDINKKSILDEKGMPIQTREYEYYNRNGKKVLIQEHTAGHKGTDDAGRSPHFNVRDPESPNRGVFKDCRPPCREHYNIKTPP